MKMNAVWMMLVLLAAACGPGGKSPAPNGDSGTDAGPNDDDVAAQDDDSLPASGVYEGTASTPQGDEKVTAALWGGVDSVNGQVVLAGERAYTLDLTEDGGVLSVAGACAGCGEGTWDFAVSRDGSRLVIDFPDSPTTPPPFVSLHLVPHDGFKPELSPEPGFEAWAGPVLAVDPSITSQPILDGTCDLLLEPEGGLNSFACGLEASAWTSIVSESMSRTDDELSFEVVSEEAELTYRGLFVSDHRESLQGEIRRADGAVVGRFDFTRQTP